MLVADGMGGLHNGALAGALVAHTVSMMVAQREFSAQSLRDSAKIANQLIYNFAQQRQLSGMGSTLVALAVSNDKAWIAAVGDSRAYLLRAGKLEQLTTDHTVLEELRASSLLKPDEGQRSPAAHMLTRSLGPKPTTAIDVWEQTIKAGDVVLLCSDGLYNMVSDARLAEIVAGKPADVVTQLITEANANGGGDNITATVVRFEPARVSAAVQDDLAFYSPQFESFAAEIKVCEADLLRLAEIAAAAASPTLRLFTEGFAMAALLFAALFADHWLPGVLSHSIKESVMREFSIEPRQEQVQPPKPIVTPAEKITRKVPTRIYQEALGEIKKILMADPAQAVWDEQSQALSDLIGDQVEFSVSPGLELKQSLTRYIELARLYQEAIGNWRKKPRDVSAGERVGTVRRELNAERMLILQMISK